MAFPPEFLDELRARLSLADVIGRRVRLAKKGREWTGLCPFHNEKSPSFFVNEDKGFFHCFGCGAHGDVIGFSMRAGNLAFPEAVEALAGEAGLELPAVMEAACVFYEQQLRAASGRPAFDYVAGRGLDAATIARFRLGYAPPIERGGQGLLKQALGRDFSEDLMAEAGLVRRPEDGRDSFDYFRDRVMFPITDRAGRVIAFGGRVLGDGQPKYLNSPETPLFHKGRVLYGLVQARAAQVRGTAAREAEVIVTEGYMDVIALHRAGFETAVAPLGTALTEEQLAVLWKLTAEPILCFDGDAAGQRAAARALDRALPGLMPGRSLRFAVLPAGEDPDTLVQKFGAPAMRAVLETARPLAETLWAIELAQAPVDTPERRADLEARLAARAAQIADRRVREQYERFFKSCVYERLRSRAARPGSPQARSREGSGQGSGRGRWPVGPAWGASAPLVDEALQRQQKQNLGALERRTQEDLVVVFLRHPDLLDDLVEDFAEVELPAPDLDKLRRQIINLHGEISDLDSAGLRHHLTSLGFARDVEALLTEATNSWATKKTVFTTPGADRETARRGWVQLRSHWMNRRHGTLDLDEAVQLSVVDMETASPRISALVTQAERKRLEDADFDGAPEEPGAPGRL
jgi:DNA primase